MLPLLYLSILSHVSHTKSQARRKVFMVPMLGKISGKWIWINAYLSAQILPWWFFWPNRCYLVFLFSSNCLQTLKIQHISKPRAFLNSFEKNSFCLVLFLYALYAKQMRWNGIVSVLQTLHGLSLDNICDTCIIPLLSGKFISTVDAPVVITV